MKNAVLQGDALDILPALPAGGCQAVIADPPYFNVLAEDWDRQWPTVDAYLRWTRQWVALCMRTLRVDGFHSQPAAVTARELSDEALLQLPSQMICPRATCRASSPPAWRAARWRWCSPPLSPPRPRPRPHRRRFCHPQTDAGRLLLHLAGPAAEGEVGGVKCRRLSPLHRYFLRGMFGRSTRSRDVFSTSPNYVRPGCCGMGLHLRSRAGGYTAPLARA